MLLPLPRPIVLQVEESPKILGPGPVRLSVPGGAILNVREDVVLVLPADTDLELLR